MANLFIELIIALAGAVEKLHQWSKTNWVTKLTFWGSLFYILLALWLGGFNSANALGDTVAGLASAMAFLWLIHTANMQRKELELQREELSLTRTELKGAKEAQQAQEKALNAQANIFEKEQEWREFEQIVMQLDMQPYLGFEIIKFGNDFKIAHFDDSEKYTKNTFTRLNYLYDLDKIFTYNKARVNTLNRPAQELTRKERGEIFTKYIGKKELLAEDIAFETFHETASTVKAPNGYMIIVSVMNSISMLYALEKFIKNAKHQSLPIKAETCKDQKQFLLKLLNSFDALYKNLGFEKGFENFIKDYEDNP